MPNAFFVITGRNRLQWADDAPAGTTRLDRARRLARPGPPVRPAVRGPPGRPAPAVPDRGLLPETDCDDYLARRLSPRRAAADRRLTSARSSPSAPTACPSTWIWPSCASWRSAAPAALPQPADFDHDLPRLDRPYPVATSPPTNAMSCARVSLLDAFDLCPGHPRRRHGPRGARAAADRTALHPRGLRPASGPTTCTALIRSALRNADDHTDDRWSPRDWHRAAQRPSPPSASSGATARAATGRC